jgi:nucleoside 2-deoxyribosyltransferase
MFYHAIIGVTGVISWLEENKTREDILTGLICPYINREVTMWDGRLFNMASYGNVRIIKTDKPIDSDWPLKKSDYIKEGKDKSSYDYEWDRQKKLEEVGEDVTEEFYREAISLLESGKYTELRRSLAEKEKGNTSFDNEEVDHNYEFVVKPCVEKIHYQIQRADEISHTRTITDVIISAINHARFVIADLTEEKPNCYYEVGYAHSIGKPVVILAKEGTQRHFDLAAHKWNYWAEYRDLKPKLEKELQGVLSELSGSPNEG